MIDSLTEMLLREWADHRARKPGSYADDYAVNIDHLRIAADQWARTDADLRHLIGERLAIAAIREIEAQR